VALATDGPDYEGAILGQQERRFGGD